MIPTLKREETGKSEIPGHPEVHSEYQASLGYIKDLSEQKAKNKIGYSVKETFKNYFKNRLQSQQVEAHRTELTPTSRPLTP